MSERTRYSVFLDVEIREGLKAVKLRDGVPESEQVRRAIIAWLVERGVWDHKFLQPAEHVHVIRKAPSTGRGTHGKRATRRRS
jgi:hypothetical protein